MKLEIFLNFNKIRALTEDVKEIARALKYSTVLKINDDETAVSRIASFLPKSVEEVENCTIYVVSDIIVNMFRIFLMKFSSRF